MYIECIVLATLRYMGPFAAQADLMRSKRTIYGGCADGGCNKKQYEFRKNDEALP